MLLKRSLSFSVPFLTGGVKPLPINPVLPNKSDKNPSSISQFFVDFKTTFIKAGNGGDGNVSFMNTKEKAFAGPDGGDGGNGGHIIFNADDSLKSLNKIKSKYQAESGIEGRNFHMKGKNGEHLVIKVPVGTLLKDVNENIIFEMTNKNSKFIAARGGSGGKGNYYFMTNERRAPQEFEVGHVGQEMLLNIELKLIADAALVGYPNVGKSSLLNALTNARAKIGDYSFTTLHPQVGIVEYEDFKQISIADLPGLLPDLSRGFGTKYLHHLEKCKMIILVLDLALRNENSPLEQYRRMKDALNSFDKKLLKSKPLLVIGNKIELQDAYDNLADVKKEIEEILVPVSVKDKINLLKFMKILRITYENEINKLNQ